MPSQMTGRREAMHGTFCLPLLPSCLAHRLCFLASQSCDHGWADETKLLLELSSWVMNEGVSVAKDYENNMISPPHHQQTKTILMVRYCFHMPKGRASLAVYFVCLFVFMISTTEDRGKLTFSHWPKYRLNFS